MRAVCAFLALIVVGAVAQDYSHIVSGGFTRGDPVQASAGIARWDSQMKRWFGTSVSTALGFTVTIVDIETTSTEVIYLLTRDGSGTSRVVQYTPSKETFVVVGEEANGGDQFNDIAVIGDRLYVCGSFNFARGRVLGQTPDPRPEVINVAYVAAASDQPRLLWSQIPPSTDPVRSTPTCNRIFGFGTRLIIASGNTLFWRTANNDWVADAANTDIAAGSGSNLRQGGVATNILFGNTYMDGNTLYMQSAAGYTLDPDTTNVYRIVSTTDGVTWAGALRFDETALNNDPRRYTADLSNFAIRSGEVYFFAQRTNGTRRYWAMHKAPVGTQAVGVQTQQTRLGSQFIGSGSTAAGGLPGTTFVWAGDKLHFVCSQNPCVNYTEAAYNNDNENDDTNMILYRYATALGAQGSVLSFNPADNSYSPELGGGLSAAPVKVVKANGDGMTNSWWFVGPFNRAWNKRWIGLAGYNSKNKEWTALGDPLVDWTRFPDSIDGSNNAGFATDFSNFGINTIHHFPVDSGAVAVITAGTFRRIYNNTYNGIAWMRTDRPGEWNQIGSTGLHVNTATHTKTITKVVPVGVNSYVKPGVVNAIASSTYGAKGKNGRTLWVGGNFLGSGSTRSEVVLNNIAKYNFGDEADKQFVALNGGVNGEVFAVDAVGQFVFVGGAFTRAGNLTVNNIAMWDDEKKTWSHMQTGVSGTVRQIWADTANNVWVLTGGVAGGVQTAHSNLQRWDGSKWVWIPCDTCGEPCENKNGYTSCNQAAVEIRRVAGRFIRRTANQLHWLDWNKWRSISATISHGAIDNSGAFRDLLAKSVSGSATRITIASNSVTGNGLSDSWTPYIAEIDLSDDNVYPVPGAGFDAPIQMMSPASTFAPVMAFVAFVLAMVLLF